jgi:hypothetical protein
MWLVTALIWFEADEEPVVIILDCVSATNPLSQLLRRRAGAATRLN